MEEHEKLLETQTIDPATGKLLAQGTLQMLVALAQAMGREDEAQKYQAMGVRH